MHGFHGAALDMRELGFGFGGLGVVDGGQSDDCDFNVG